MKNKLHATPKTLRTNEKIKQKNISKKQIIYFVKYKTVTIQKKNASRDGNKERNFHYFSFRAEKPRSFPFTKATR